MAYRNSNDTAASTVVYEGIEVGYYEGTNDWTFTLRGRERTVESLAKAKEAIDKPVAEKKETFKPVAGYKLDSWGRDKFQPLTITSLIEGGAYCWVNNPSDTGYRSSGRSKESSEKIYLNTAANNVLITEWKELDVQQTEIENKKARLIKRMKTANSLAQEVSE